jgi:regulatory protein
VNRQQTPQAPVDRDDPEAALDAALRILGGASQSADALRHKLHQRGFSNTAARSALDRCRELGYVDYTELAQSLVGRHTRAGHGRARVIADMRRRGVSPAAAAQALDRLDEAEEQRAASEVAQKLYDREAKRGDVDDRARQRIAAALQRRGYESGVILSALRSVRT